MRRDPDETVEEFAQRAYCVCGVDGRVDPDRVRRVAEAVARAYTNFADLEEIDPPHVPGVPHLRYRVDDVSQIPEAVRRFLPEVEADPRLHALSFVDPLRLAVEELGVVISPVVARAVRRALGGWLSFNAAEVLEQGTVPAITRARWLPRSP